MAEQTLRVVVDGAGGFLGGHLVPALLAQGHEVLATDLAGVPLLHLAALGARTLPADLVDQDSLDRVLEGMDAVVHAAALFDVGAPPARLHAVNVEGTAALCRAAARQGVRRLVHISSCDVYGPLITVPATEEHRFHPINPYAESKAEAEAVVRRCAQEQGLQLTILRPSVMYGPGSRYIASILFAVPAILVGHGVRAIPFFHGGIRFTPVHVQDVARAVVFVLAAEAAVGQAYNVAQPEVTTISAFFQEILRAMGLRVRFTVPLPSLGVSLVGRIGLALPERVVQGVIDRLLVRQWRRIEAEHGLDPGFVLRFHKEIFSYFIGERAYSTERLLEAGFRYLYPSAAAGMPPTIRWYVDRRWLPAAPP